MSDFNCAEFKDGECKKCSSGFYFGEEKTCKASNPLCRLFNQDNGKCTECYIGFVLSDGTCIIDDNFESGESLCAEWKEKICLRCASRAYFNEQGVCTGVSELCKTFDQLDGSCKTCYPGFKIEDDQCVQAPEGEGEGCAEYG